MVLKEKDNVIVLSAGADWWPGYTCTQSRMVA